MKKNLAVIFGGRSGEHEISIISARSVSIAASASGFKVIPIYITRDGKWLGEIASKNILDTDYETLIKNPAKLKIQQSAAKKLAKTSSFKFDFSKIDVAFPVMHGTFGEDGTIQGLLEMHDVPYVGCGVMASSLTMDKAMSKVHFLEAHLNVCDFVVVSRSEIETSLKKVVTAVEENLTYPVFVKPANLGSSVGISKAKNRKDLEIALKNAAMYDRKILIEQGLDVRELEIAVLGNDSLEVSVVGEVVPCNEFYDYEAKYVKGDSKLFIPALIPKEIERQIKEAAKVAYQSVGCEGMARVDFFLEKKTNTIYINELNTIPGFTSISMYPKMFAASGINYASLVKKLISLALERYADTRRNKTF